MPARGAGRFVTFEGIDGAGKSTHIEPLAQRLRDHGLEVVVTREPGGTTLAEALRGLLLSTSMDGLTEVLLVFAARRDHLRGVIEPALARGATVLCDRFTDATFAYQGAGRGMPQDVLRQLEQWVQDGRQPDLTLWFDAPTAQAARRRAGVREPDRFERLDEAFFTRVRDGYLARATQAPARFVRLDASQPRDEVWRELAAAVDARRWW
jgi:dTMP kinase